jgi:hypothetical protein
VPTLAKDLERARLKSQPTRSILYNKVIIDDGLVLAATYPYDSTLSRFLQLGYGDALRDGVTAALHQTRDACGLGASRTIASADTSPASKTICTEARHWGICRRRG